MDGRFEREAGGMGVQGRAVTGMVATGVVAGEVEEGFAGLVDRQSRLMFRVASSVLRARQDAEDAVQEAFLQMYRTGAWRGAKEETAYVARVVWRVAVRRAKARRRRMGDEDVTEMQVASRGEGAEGVMAREGDADRLRRMVEGLPETLRRPLVLCAIDEMGSREVGIVLGLPEGTVRRRVMRAKEELRRRWNAAHGGRTR